jgi:hypothetical protein
MAVIRFIGDVHGKTERYQNIVRNADEEGAATFQLGDMGLGFKGVKVPLDMDDQHRFIRGNHDDPASCWMHPAYAGDFGYDPKYDLFFLGGAFSIDYEWRQRAMLAGGDACWWDDEELSERELDIAIQQCIEHKPRIIATHEAPASVAEQLLLPIVLRGSGNDYFGNKMVCVRSRTAKALDRLFNAWHPQYWIFGHYHTDWTAWIQSTTFHCCAELSTFDIEFTT